MYFRLLYSVLSPRLHLQNGFREMTASNPDFIHDVEYEKLVKDKDIATMWKSIKPH